MPISLIAGRAILGSTQLVVTETRSVHMGSPISRISTVMSHRLGAAGERYDIEFPVDHPGVMLRKAWLARQAATCFGVRLAATFGDMRFLDVGAEKQAASRGLPYSEEVSPKPT